MQNYYLPTKIYFGSGILKNLPDILDKEIKKEVKDVYLITDNFFLNNGTVKKIKDSLPKMNVKVVSGILPNPTMAQVEKVRSLIKNFKADFVIAIGGGSVLDTAKSAAILVNNEGRLIDFLIKKRELTQKGIPFIAIPTTSGTGSEVTPWATIWGGDKTKYSLASPLMFPSIALCDPELTLSLPPFITACTGMDALSQAVEAYWSIHSNLLSDSHAVSGMSLAINNLEGAVKKPKDISYREKMMLAALETGRAFSQTATTACHAVSYPMTAFFNIPHGYACALTLSAFLEYNYKVNKNDCNDKRGPEFVKQRIADIIKYLGCRTVKDACLKINNIMKSIGLETSLKKAGVTDIEIIIKNGFNPERVVNNPRLVTEENLRKLLKEIY